MTPIKSFTMANIIERLYKKIRCPECFSEKDLKHRKNKVIKCDKCKTKYEVRNGVAVLFSKESRKALSDELKSGTGKNMVKEYVGKKQAIKLPDLTYDIIDRKRLHKIFTFDENEKYIILNVGGGPKREERNVLNLNIGPFPNVDVVGDAHNLPFRSNSVDGVMIAAVLEHVKDPIRVVEEAYRIVKKGGYIYAETPFLQHFHGYPNHFQNFTLIGHDYLFRKFRKIESGAITGPFSTVFILILNLIEDFIDNKYIRKILLLSVAYILYPFKFLDRLFIKNDKTYRLTNGVYFLGQK